MHTFNGEIVMCNPKLNTSEQGLRRGVSYLTYQRLAKKAAIEVQVSG